MPSPHLLRISTLALILVSVALSLSIIGTASRTVDIFNHQRRTNAWFLPLWPNHFDLREPYALLGCSAAIVVLDAVLAGATVLRGGAGDFIALIPASLGAAVAVVELGFTASLQSRDVGGGSKDTLLTWTCGWSGRGVAGPAGGQSPPRQFRGMCDESRFAFYATIPVFVLQLSIVGLAVYGMVEARRRVSRHRGDGEEGWGKGQGHRLSTLHFEAKGGVGGSLTEFGDGVGMLGEKA